MRRYDADHLARIAMPIGGIGTGTVSLGGRGDLRDFEVMNRPAKGFTPPETLVAISVRGPARETLTRLLEGPLEAWELEGAIGATARNHGWPRFRHATFAAAYPLGSVELRDPDMPVTVRLEAFNPLIPGDTGRSSLPVAILRYVVTNMTREPLAATLCASLKNFIGFDGLRGAAVGNVNELVDEPGTPGLRGILLASRGVDPASERWGTMALATPGRGEVSRRRAWARRSWGDSLLDFWDDLHGDGRLDDRPADGIDDPTASLAVLVDLGPLASTSVTFLIAWHFPGRRTWSALPTAPGDDPARIGNHYATRFADAWDVARSVAAALPELERSTVDAIGAICESDLPPEVLEAALFNISTLRTQTCFRTADGRFYGWEGCNDHEGSCPGSCTHVWNYEQATAYLFGDLARSMREVEFEHATDDLGLMSFRVELPLERAQEFRLAAADGQMGAIMRLYRDWRLSGDDAFLRRLWPGARRALAFAWVPGGWDADRDGVMEGCQHNTMDVEYYGPNPQMAGWYLGALRAAEEMAEHVGELELAAECRRLFESGSAWVDGHLFNGAYYEHEIRPPGHEDAIAPGLRHESMGAQDLHDPELQLGAGCLVDQLVGQYAAHVYGLGYLLDPVHVRATLQSLMTYNFRTDLWAHFNHLRTFAAADESALLMATYPRGRRPQRPFPYFNEVMTGYEYVAAVHMIYEGMTEEGLRVMRAIRARYDGRKRNPFDEAECGHHYARAMASWAGLLAWTGFRFEAGAGRLVFRAASGPVRWFWSNGASWGVCEQRPDDHGWTVRLSVGFGQIELEELELAGAGRVRWRRRTIRPGRPAVARINVGPDGPNRAGPW